MYFPVAGIEANPLTLAAVAFGVSFFCSTTGVSGAFLLLPYQFSVLGYTRPGVSATNQIFNIIACPGGVWRYAREGRLLLPLAFFIISGTLPGVFLGALVRIHFLASPEKFRVFAGCVLLYLAWRMLCGKSKKDRGAGNNGMGKCEVLQASIKGFSFIYDNSVYRVSGLGLFCLSLLVGLAGGIYGVGGGAIMVPFLVAFFGLPVHAIAGASLFATFATSVAGAAFYSLLAILEGIPQAAPDWALGILLGIGGLCGMYCGAAAQKHISGHILRLFLAGIIIFTSLLYFAQSLF